jgi:hypothetical protein
LEDVSVGLEAPEGWEMIAEVNCPRLEYNVSGTTYAVFELPEEITESIGNVPRVLTRTCAH